MSWPALPPPGVAIPRRIRVLMLQICGKCIGGTLSRWSSTGAPDFGQRDSQRLTGPRGVGGGHIKKSASAATRRRWSRSGSRCPSNDKSAAGRGLMRSRQIRRIFFVELFRLIRVVWPILSGVLFAMVGPGLLIGHIEGWRIDEALYFTFVTGLTIGYGDLTPRHVVSRLLAVVIGFAGIVLTGLVVAVSRGGAPGDGPRY